MLNDPQNHTVKVPALLTVEEAARVLRIGRTAAYELARRDLATSGGEGLRVVRVGRLLRVPRVALEDMVGGPFTIPAPEPTPPADLTDRPTPTPAPPTPAKPIPSAPRRSSRSTETEQTALPFAS